MISTKRTDQIRISVEEKKRNIALLGVSDSRKVIEDYIWLFLSLINMKIFYCYCSMRNNNSLITIISSETFMSGTISNSRELNKVFNVLRDSNQSSKIF